MGSLRSWYLGLILSEAKISARVSKGDEYRLPGTVGELIVH